MNYIRKDFWFQYHTDYDLKKWFEDNIVGEYDLYHIDDNAEWYIKFEKLEDQIIFQLTWDGTDTGHDYPIYPP